MRSEFRAHPPDILLTNYRMLEYLLLRGDGRALFRNHAVRFIVLDEVHTYKGALGTDVACLVRRLRAALGEANPLFIGTSATLQSGRRRPTHWCRGVLRAAHGTTHARGVGHSGADRRSAAAQRNVVGAVTRYFGGRSGCVLT